MCLALGCGHVGAFPVQAHFTLTELCHMGAVAFLMIQVRELRVAGVGSSPSVTHLVSQGAGMGLRATVAPEPCANPLGHSSCGRLSRTRGAGPGKWKDPLFTSFLFVCFFPLSYTRLPSLLSPFTIMQSPFVPAD